MTARARPAESYVHGMDGPVVAVPGRIAAWLERAVQLRDLRVSVRGVDPEVDAVLVALGVAAAAWRQSTAGGCDTATDQDEQGPDGAPSWLTVTEAAGLLGITPQGIRAAISRGRLAARPSAGGILLVRREDVQHYKARRAA